MSQAAIGVVGMACVYPDATSPQQLWENALSGRRAFRCIPSERLNLDDYFSSDLTAVDAIYAREAAVIEGYEFDRVKFSIAGSTYRAADLVHWLALDVADRALMDAGFPDGKGLPLETTGVLVGNTLTGEFSRANLMRLRWPYVRRTVDAQLRARGMSIEERDAFLDQLQVSYKAPFPAIGEESLAGSLSNTIAGRICNQFHFHGGGYSVDGACSSSLLAVAQACTALAVGDLDVALVGGVDLSLDPFELVGFAKTSALSHGLMRVYDRDADGFLPGEGAGFVLLMREEDAIARGAKIYATIRGWGISSDGGGGITRPEVHGQRLALERAYRRAGYSIGSVGYFEGHGTGTAVGDEVELRTLSDARRGADPGADPGTPAAAIGSVKAIIGHTKAAAGIAGFIKTTLALQRQIIPPAVGVERPHALLSGEGSALTVLRQGRRWASDRPLRAGVSSFGFGGINVHVTLEGAAVARRTSLTADERTLLSTRQDAELLLLGAKDGAELAAQVDRLLNLAAGISYAELTDLAIHLSNLKSEQNLRAALVVASPQELADKLATLRHWIAQGVTRRIDLGAGVFLGASATQPRIAFVFPGQASPVRLNGGLMARRFASTADLYQRAALPQQADPHSTAVAQPAIVTAELAALQLLHHLGIEADVALGHSLGELTALHWAGALDESTLLSIAKIRGQVMAAVPGPRGAMASIAAPAAEVDALLGGRRYVVIAGFNSPQQTVISGVAEVVTDMVAKLRVQGKVATLLPVANGFHCPLMAPAAEVLGAELAEADFQSVGRVVYSTVQGGLLGVSEDLRGLLKRQLTQPVRFAEALHGALQNVDLCIEVGPGKVLTGLVRECSEVPVVAVDAASESMAGLLHAVGAAYALGATINRQAAFGGRFCRAFDLNRPPRFFANPCESAPRLGASAPTRSVPLRIVAIEPASVVAPSVQALAMGDQAGDILEYVRTLVAQRAELPQSAIKDDSRLLMDLHLNSISVGQLVVEAARQLSLSAPTSPTEYADATVADVARALRELKQSGASVDDEKERVPAGVDAWVRAYVVDQVACALPSQAADYHGNGDWQILAAPGHPLAESLAAALTAWGNHGVVVCLSAGTDDGHAGLLLQAAHQALASDQEGGYFVLLQDGSCAASLAKTLFLEKRDLTVCVVDAPHCAQTVDWVLREVQVATGYTEARYDAHGVRYEPRLRLHAFTDAPSVLPLGAQDVLLVSGGGKGIAAECALALAEDSGVRLVLLGRSEPDADAALAANLARLAGRGVTFRYYVADVADPAAVRAAVVQAEAALGPITGVLHGAGINHPVLLRNLDAAAFQRTLAPKVDGVRNVLAAVDSSQLRVLITFSSIIGRTGLRGEGDYAFANERLTRLTEDFHAAHPNCRCLALEWSVWSGVGMGERLGRIDALIREGIGPITPETGIGMLRSLLSHAQSTVAVVVSGRFGPLPTLRQPSAPLPFLRFLETPLVYYPGVELVVSAELSTESDPYLDDHVFQGTRLFPAVMGMEAMAQVAVALNAKGTDTPPSFEQIEFLRPVVVGQEQSVTIRIAALVRASNEIELVLRSSTTGFQTDHFRAICRFDLNKADVDPVSLPATAGAEVPLDVEHDVYDGLLFHTGRFRRLRGYRHLSATTCCATIAADDDASWFGRYLPTQLLLGDPATRDTAIHAIQACIPHALLLPTGVECWLPGNQHARGPFTLQARERWRAGDEFCYDLDVYSDDGQVRERWRGLKLRKMGSVTYPGQWPLPLLGPFMERRLQELLPSVSLTLSVTEGALAERRSRSDLAARQALGKDLPIWRRPDGRPETVGGQVISMAHAGALTIAVAGSGAIACDLEIAAMDSSRPWQDLLGVERHALAAHIAQEAHEPLFVAATRVWSAVECMKKAGLLLSTPITLAAIHPDGWVLLRAGVAAVASYATHVRGNADTTVLSVLTAGEQQGRVAEATGRGSILYGIEAVVNG